MRGESWKDSTSPPGCLDKGRDLHVLLVAGHERASGYRRALDAGTDAEFSVVHREDHQQGLTALRAGGFDALVLDLRLGERTATESIHDLRSCAPRLPIVALLPPEQGVQEGFLAIKAGAQDFLLDQDLDPATLRRTLLHSVVRGTAQAGFMDMERRLHDLERYESLGRLAGRIAHDFNNIVQRILGNAALAQNEIPSASKAHARVERIQQAAISAGELTGQLMAYAGDGQSMAETVDLSGIVDQVGRILETGIPEGVAVDYDLASDLSLTRGDPYQIKQVVMSLLMNAIEATGGLERRVRIATGALDIAEDLVSAVPAAGRLAPGRHLYIEVADNGHGIDAKLRDAITDPFFSTRGTGRGMGLAAVVGILRRHRGGLAITSWVGKGTTVRAYLPAIEEAASELEPHRGDRQRRGRILLVDADEMILEIGSHALEEAGFEVRTASDGERALRIHERYPDIRLVVLDSAVPGIQGKDLIASLRLHRPELRVIVATGFAEDPSLASIAGTPIDGFLRKPFLPSRLVNLVEEALQHAEGERAASTKAVSGS